jgi:hypothetical protein
MLNSKVFRIINGDAQSGPVRVYYGFEQTNPTRIGLDAPFVLRQPIANIQKFLIDFLIALNSDRPLSWCAYSEHDWLLSADQHEPMRDTPLLDALPHPRKRQPDFQREQVLPPLVPSAFRHLLGTPSQSYSLV